MELHPTVSNGLHLLTVVLPLLCNISELHVAALELVLHLRQTLVRLALQLPAYL